MLLIDNEYFACLLYKEGNYKSNIIYFNIENLIGGKSINNIDCTRKEINILFLFKQYLLIKGEFGISILSNKTKDLVQYIDFNYIDIYEIIPDNNDSFYILLKDRNLFLEKYKLIEGSFIQIEEHKKIEISEEDEKEILSSPDSSNNDYSFISFNSFKYFNGFCINKNDIFFWKDNIFHLKEKK